MRVMLVLIKTIMFEHQLQGKESDICRIETYKALVLPLQTNLFSFLPVATRVKPIHEASLGHNASANNILLS